MKQFAVKLARLPLAAMALGASALSAQDPAQPLWPQASYNLMDVRGDGDAEALVRRAVAASPPESKPPLMQGWMFPNLYAHIYADHHVMFRVHGEGVEQRVCRVTVLGLPDSKPIPALLGFGRGEKLWCQEPGRADIVPTADEQRAAWPRGRLGQTAQFTTPDGLRLTVRHIIAPKRWIWPVPPKALADVKLLTWLPQSRASSAGKKHHLHLLHLGNGRWALSFKVARDFGSDLSGCFIQPTRPGALIPQESWLTPAIESWCRTQADRHLAALPASERPVVPPTAPPPIDTRRGPQAE